MCLCTISTVHYFFKTDTILPKKNNHPPTSFVHGKGSQNILNKKTIPNQGLSGKWNSFSRFLGKHQLLAVDIVAIGVCHE